MNALFGEPFSRADLVPAGLEAESIVSGYHADNIAPALMGGFVLIRYLSQVCFSVLIPFRTSRLLLCTKSW